MKQLYFQLYTTPKQPPSLNPVHPYDYSICLFILHVIHSCEPVDVSVWLSTPVPQIRTPVAVVLWQQIETCN